MQYKNGTPLGDTVTCRDIYGDQVTLPLEKMIFRNSVYGLILNEGNLLVVRTRSTGLYAFPGGGIEMGEPIADALHREIREETGINVEMGELATLTEDFFYYNPGDEAYHALLLFYWCQPLTTALVTDADVYDEESEAPRWVPIRELAAEDFQIICRPIFQLIQKTKSD
ncbi:MAG: NUDIX domain-containing protein [Anaerolineaceae bacterium]|nr:NUDIX domain-containing protein [Anaerolineaceae bacterium]